MRYDFEWDSQKAQSNFRKHNVSFEDAATVFRDPKALTIFDDEHSINEERWITLGISSSGKLLVTCHTFQEIDSKICVIRIFSSRRATKKEAKQYRG